MALPVTPGNPHKRKLSRHSRHIIRHMLKTRRTGHQRASVLSAQVDALDYDVNRRHSAKKPPGESHGLAGHRIRIGVEVRDLLRKLRASRNLRVQQQLVKEIRHAVQRRIRIHARRKATAARIRIIAKRTRAAAGKVRSRAVRFVRDRVKSVAQRNWNSTRRPAARTVNRSRTPSTARTRVVPGGDRASRGTRSAASSRTSRSRTSGSSEE
jgi:hypothetical protein